MFGTFVKYQFQRTYDAILAAPVDTEELVTRRGALDRHARRRLRLRADARRDRLRARPAWGMLHRAVHRLPRRGFGWACFGIMVAGFAKAIENFNYIVSAVLTPLFLVAGTFFPINKLPAAGRRSLAQLNPLHHTVELVRHAAFGFHGDRPRCACSRSSSSGC